ncbi:DUF6603 domain-containing protein [Streptomyces sp. NPDC021096]|uniref:DUF6603 domain-containing protein n=1 Tax=Streptomyces sp. NPDC021096 TaxID=3154792 RepID=UPI0033CCED29
MTDGVWDQLPTEAVATLTSASLRLEFPSSGKAGLGLALTGTADGRQWQAGIASAHHAADGRMTLAVAGVAPAISLMALPVVGPKIPVNAAALSRLALVARSGTKAPGKDLVDRLQSLLNGAGGKALPQLDTALLAKRASVGAEVNMAGTPVRVWRALGSDGTREAGTPGTAAELLPEDTAGPDGEPSQPRAQGQWWGSAADGPSIPDAEDSGTGEATGTGRAVQAATWVDVRRALGPLQVHRVGVAYTTSPKRLWLLIDASLGAVGLVFDAVGLGMGVALGRSLAVEGTLDGLGLSYTAGPVRVAGALVRETRPKPPLRLLVSGILVVTTPQIGFLAAGMYGEMTDGRVTVFVVGQVTGLQLPLGPVVVTGLLGGFGYNSCLAVPEKAAEVPRYPLVAGIGDEKAMPVTSGAAAVLKKLGSLVTPAGDHVWVAVGARFTVFKVVECSAVVAVQVAPGDVMVALLGVARARFPQNDNPYASLTLGLRAVYRLSTGELSVSGALDPGQSYLVSKDCKIQGEFAVCTWVPPSAHTGDFVITFGGYHPAYRPSPHYPKGLERVGVNWQPSSAVVVRGEAYAAVTPSMLQVGGMLRVEYSSSRVSAWLRAELHATVQWEPFRFEAFIGVTVGVEIRFMGTHHLELDVELTLWGPPTGGVAHLKLPVVPDVYVRFGGPRPTAVDALSWDAFRGKVLAGATLQAGVAGGLLQEQQPGEGGKNKTPQVALAQLALSVRTPAPCTHLQVRTGDGSHTTVAGTPTATVPIRPMNRTAVTAGCTLILKAATGAVISLARWGVAPQHGGLPVSAWGAPLGPSASPPVRPDTELLPGQVIGARLVPPPPTRTDPLIGPIPKTRLEAESGRSGRVPGPDNPSGSKPTDGSRGQVASTLATEKARRAREGLYARWTALGLAPGTAAMPPLDPLTGYVSRLWSTVTCDPMLVPTSGKD